MIITNIMDDLILTRVMEYVPVEDGNYFTKVCRQWHNIPHTPKRRRFCMPHRSISQFKEVYENINYNTIKLEIIYKFFTFGRFDILSFSAIEKILCNSFAISPEYHDKVMYTVLQQGHMHIIHKLLELRCHLPKDSIRYGCYSGSIHILNFLQSNGFYLGNECYGFCMERKHDDMIDYFIKGYLPWNFREVNSKARESQFMLSVAKNGKPETMIKCIAYGLICVNCYSIEKAILFDRLPMVKALIGCGVDYIEYDNECSILVLAVRNSDLDMVKYLHLSGYKLGDNVREEAIIQEKFDIVEYIDNLI